jgi:two-component system, NarL family, response regulator DegU
LAKPVVLLLFQQSAVAEATRQLLISSRRFDDVRYVENGTSALQYAISSDRLELAVIQLNLGGLNGERIITGLRKAHSAAHVVLVAETVDEAALMIGIRAGAGAVVPASIDEHLLAVTAIRVSRGESLLSRDVMENTALAQQLFAMLRAGTVEVTPNQSDALFDRLTAREIAVLDGVVYGMTNREIADYLFVTEQTIKNQMTVVLRKLGAKDRGQAIELACTNGWTSKSIDQIKSGRRTRADLMFKTE